MEKTRRQLPPAALGLLIGALLLLGGCAGKAAAPAVAEPSGEPQVLHMETPAPVPEAVPEAGEAVPEPDMAFEDDGDIYFSDAYKDRFRAKGFAFDHAPRVLIYHTHAREAFREEPGQAAESTPRGSQDQTPAPSGATPAPSAMPSGRSTDKEKNVVHIGDLLAAALTQRGVTVIHDRSDVEEPSLSTAYIRSRAVMEQYTDVDLYIDLHRNAASLERAKDDVVLLNGKRVARLFFVVGTGLKADSAEKELPNWKENYILALALYEKLLEVDPALVKENRMKQGVYNQDLGLSLLCEIGHNANLLTDAENTVPYLADALAAVIRF